MKSWVRIASATFILIGGTIFFGHWSLVQFDHAFDNLSDFHVANTASVPLRIMTNDVQIGTTSSEVLASSSSITFDGQISTTSPEISGTFSTSTDLSLFFTFPKKDDDLYMGCTYQISWQSPTAVNLLRLGLSDAGTGEIAGPIASGLARENEIKTDSQNLNWKVGRVWPGEYYIRVFEINSIEANFKSKIFEIHKMPANISTDEQENICQESGGSL